jgi:hypothetical protein
MSFTGNFSCNTLRAGLASGSINLTSDTFRLALYTNDATLDQTTTAYTTTGESSGGNYAAGGQVVTTTVSSQTTSAGSVTYVTFSSPAWTGAITARGALIYKAGDNGAVCVLDFGNDKTSTSTFTVTMPANTSTSALIRIV